MNLPKQNTDIGLLIIRLSLGILMLLHGVAKLIHGPGFIESIVESAGLPAFFAYGVYVGEVIAPLFIIFGYATRLASAIFAFNMIVAVALAHSADIFTLSMTGGWTIELQGLYFFASLALIFAGGGKYSLSSKHIWD